MIGKFWMVGTLDEEGKLVYLDKDEIYKHESEAKTVAETRARMKTGTRYVVLEAVDNVRKSDIAWEPCYEGLPF